MREIGREVDLWCVGSWFVLGCGVNGEPGGIVI